MSSDKENTFCFIYMSKVPGIQVKTIDLLIDHGFDSIHTFLAVKVDIDLEQIHGLLLGQKTVLRKAIEDLQNDLKSPTTRNNSFFRPFFAETLSGEDKESTIENTKTPLLSTSSVLASTSTPKPVKEGTDRKDMSKQVVDRRQSEDSNTLSVSEKFGLRSATKIKPKTDTDQQNGGKINGTEPEVVDTVLAKTSGFRCNVCQREGKHQFQNGVLCIQCLRFYQKYKDSDVELVCDSGDGDCLISKKSNRNCRSCRMDRALDVVGDTVGVPNTIPVLEDMSSHNKLNGKEQSFDSFFESSEYVKGSQPLINLSPIKPSVIEALTKGNPPKKAKKTCKVCGDAAKCNNYGVLSCNGCGVFFYRVTVGEFAIGSCIHGNGCDITALTRNKCKHCRFEACRKAGMNIVSKPAQEDSLNTDSGEPEAVRDEPMASTSSYESPTIGSDYASIVCGRTPDSPKPKSSNNKRRRRR